MAYTLGEAARATGLNKTSILKALKTGKISGSKENGQWCIQPCELHRVYPARSEATGQDNGLGNDRHPPDNPLVAAATDALVAELRSVIADLRSDRDHWRSQAEASQRLLTDQRTAAPKQSLWRWLRSTG